MLDVGSVKHNRFTVAAQLHSWEDHMSDRPQTGEYSIGEKKSYVKIRYTCRIPDGPVLRGAGGPEEMDFVTGYLHVIPGLEQRLIGKQAGDKLGFTVPAEEAFGHRHDELVIRKDRDDFHFPSGMEPSPGMEIPFISNLDEGPETALIREVHDDTIVIDLNHPLAGAALMYDLEIIEARPAKDTDVCAEWDAQSSEQTACSAINQIVLGQPDSYDN